MRRLCFAGNRLVIMAAFVALVVHPAIAAAIDGRAIYNFRCYFCHGYSGDARTLAAQMLIPGPRDFTVVDPAALTREQMLAAVRSGRPGTAMKPFASVLTDQEIDAVVDFVRDEFMQRGAANTRYHIPENGWPAHERFAAAFPFVQGEIALSADEGALTAQQRAGRQLYLSSCISCHDLAGRSPSTPVWEAEAVSYPRTGFATGDFLDPPDAYSGATTFARHEVPPVLDDAGGAAKAGEALFQANCAFCHAADGTGKNWIGTFMEPHPRNLTSRDEMQGMTRERLAAAIRDGLPGTSMPAWRHVLSDAQIHEIVEYIDRVFYTLSISH